MRSVAKSRCRLSSTLISARRKLSGTKASLRWNSRSSGSRFTPVPPASMLPSSSSKQATSSATVKWPAYCFDWSPCRVFHSTSWYYEYYYLCLPLSVQANSANVAAARLMSKQLTMNSGYRGWYKANVIAVWYARQAIPKRSRIYIYITYQKCNTCMTSKVRGIFRPTQQSMITKEHSHRNKSSKHRTRIKTK